MKQFREGAAPTCPLLGEQFSQYNDCNIPALRAKHIRTLGGKCTTMRNACASCVFTTILVKLDELGEVKITKAYAYRTIVAQSMNMFRDSHEVLAEKQRKILVIDQAIDQAVQQYVVLATPKKSWLNLVYNRYHEWREMIQKAFTHLSHVHTKLH